MMPGSKGLNPHELAHKWISMRYKPYEHTANAKGDTAAQPYIKVIGLPVLCKDVLEHEE